MAEFAWRELLSTWLSGCIEKHELCTPREPAPLPKRVIDVLSREDPFLLETNGERAHYIALSYCWGKTRDIDMMSFGPNSKRKRGLPVVKPNMEAHKAKIPFSAMPGTFQDAVTVARGLDIRYLWIDALCIIQADDEAWQEEHPRMADVYANANFVIAADNSAEPQKGFLNKCALGTQPPKQNAIVMPSTKCPSPLDWDEPLTNRAWSLSEAIFANRIIHFTSSEIIWECNEVRRSENGCFQVFQGEDDTDSFRLFRNPMIARHRSKADLYQKWNKAVEHFTMRKINSHPDETYKDSLKLVALERVAKRFSEISEEVLHRKDFYLAGLWRNNLENSILWSVEKGLEGNYQMECRRPVTPRAPTWSWAAIEGPVFYEQTLSFEPEFIIEDASITYLDDNSPFGQVSSGELILRGKILHGLKVQVDGQADSGRNKHAVKAYKQGVDAYYSFLFDLPVNEVDMEEEFSSLYLGQGNLEGPNKDGTHVYPAFLLLRQKHDGTQAFERVGISSTRIRKDHVSVLVDLMKVELIIIT